MTEIFCLYKKCMYNEKTHCNCESITINEYQNCNTVENRILITPKPGEAWIRYKKLYFVLDNGIYLTSTDDVHRGTKDIVHGKDGWFRIYPAICEKV